MLINYFHTIKHLKTRQTIGRAYAAFKKKINLRKIKIPASKISGQINTKTSFLNHDPWNSADEILKGNFCFLNIKENLGSPIDWQVNEMPPLWKFNLHYFNYLYLLDKSEQINICKDWIEYNPLPIGTGWSPYTTSLRIVNWIKADIDDDLVTKSLFQQSEYLYRNLEFYHPGNHYLENAKALVFAGIYFKEIPQSKKWLGKGIKIFSKELQVQVFDDGGYFELTQMYHAIMLHGFLDILNLLPKTYDLYNTLSSIVIKMLDFLKSNTHPNGEIALFNDSTTEIAPSTERLFTYAQQLLDHTPKFKSSFIDSGYYIYKDEDIYMIIDGGAIGPDYLPAHAHSDIFSYELSVDKKKFIVDSGVFEYTRGKIREEFRSTKSHNTVAIDKVDQVECWDSFRVARRFKPSNIIFAESENGFEFRGNFNGYAKLIGDKICHERTITLNKKQREIIISEKISGKNEHLVESYIHLAPNSDLVETNEGYAIKLDSQKIDIKVVSGKKKIENSTYCPQFGKKLDNFNIIINESSSLPVNIQYKISY
jgi:uncharacterized heparinase superfamily protein